MVFDLFGGRTVKELRKKRGYTARELAAKAGVSVSVIMRADSYKIKSVPEPLRGRIKKALATGKQAGTVFRK